MTVRFTGAGSGLLATFAAGTIPPSTAERGLFVTALFYGLADGATKPLFEFSAGGAAPDLAVRVENSNGNARLRVRDASGQAVYTAALAVGGGAYARPGWVRASALLLRAPDDTEYRVALFANAVKAAQNANNDAAATSGIEAAFTQLAVGMGYGANAHTDDMADAAFGFGVSEALAEEIHLALYNGGAHRSMLETPYAALMHEDFTVDRVGAGESVADGDAELGGAFGRLGLVNSAAAGAPVWSDRATPYVSPPPPSFGDDPLAPDDPISQMQVGDSAILFEHATLFYRTLDDLGFTVAIDAPQRLDLTDAALANSGLTQAGEGAYTFLGPYTAIAALFQALPFRALDNGPVSVAIAVSDGVHTVTRVVTLTIVDRNPITPLAGGAYSFGPVALGAHRDFAFGLYNTDGAPQTIDIDTITLEGAGFALVVNPAPVAVPYGLRAAAEDYPVGVVRFTPGAVGDHAATLTITTDSAAHEDAINDPLVIALTGAGVDLPLVAAGCVDLAPQLPAESGELGVPWSEAHLAAAADGACAVATVEGLLGNYSTRRLVRRFDLAGRFPDGAVVREGVFTVRAATEGDAPMRLAFAEVTGPATGYASGNLIAPVELTDALTSHEVSLADAAVKPTGADLAQGAQLEVYFSVPFSALGAGESTSVRVDALLGPDQLCVAGGAPAQRGRGRTRARWDMIALTRSLA